MNPPPGSVQIFRAIDVIRKKRDGGELPGSEIQSLVNAYTRGDIPDYQVSAWLMAVVLRGMTRAETASLTDAMLQSGEVLDLSSLASKKVDKHSTGGVGDKTSLVLAPLAAAAGITVPMISGGIPSAMNNQRHPASANQRIPRSQLAKREPSTEAAGTAA